MILISHRGNTLGPNPKMENKPKYIMNALKLKYQVEIDVWCVGGTWFSGHDKPQYKINIDFLCTTPGIWAHCKNKEAMVNFCGRKINGNLCPMFFWHETDTYALTSNMLLWTYPRRPLTDISIAVLPELSYHTDKELSQCIGICSDHVKAYKKKFK
jgi:hypothetical protein